MSASSRLLIATSKQRIKSGQFREDLYYRLSVVVINLPPLRDRKDDIPDLVNYFLRKYSVEFQIPDPSIHAEALQFLQAQNWPGNVRELENTVRKTLLLARGYTINADHARAAAMKGRAGTPKSEQSLREHADELLAAAQRGELQDAHARLMDAAEREIFCRAIELAHGNQAKASRWLGVSRLTMREKLLQFGVHPAQDGKTTA